MARRKGSRDTPDAMWSATEAAHLPTLKDAREVPAGANGWPAYEPPEVVKAGGFLWDRCVVVRPHSYALVLPECVSPLLAAALRSAWKDVEQDVWRWAEGGRFDTYRVAFTPENRAKRARLEALAAAAAGSHHGAALERRRAWRVIDWEIRTEAPVYLELAGWTDYGEAFRALPPITSAKALSVGALRMVRAAYRETDKASTAALRGVSPYTGRGERRRRRASGRDAAPNVGRSLGPIVRQAFPNVRRAVVGEGLRSDLTDVGRAAQAGAWARTCIDRDPRISRARKARTEATIDAAAETLFHELAAMRPGVQP